MKNIKLKVKELKKIGFPISSRFFTISKEGETMVYNVTFFYKGKLYTTTVKDYYLEGYRDNDELLCIFNS